MPFLTFLQVQDLLSRRLLLWAYFYLHMYSFIFLTITCPVHMLHVDFFHSFFSLDSPLAFHSLVRAISATPLTLLSVFSHVGWDLWAFQLSLSQLIFVILVRLTSGSHIRATLLFGIVLVFPGFSSTMFLILRSVCVLY